ncbi:hypothetical protein BDV29DRAFT_183942 [Aspergillus leporis]|uniref:Uncharacterized protein n=1 Tax=Aspergillus leporis TaxID=41062 RepID=A0A5N5WN93_9EURO|nr:hypothetical protein BDV29DRAFT_183942 [Aspergillus leporis]
MGGELSLLKDPRILLGCFLCPLPQRRWVTTSEFSRIAVHRTYVCIYLSTTNDIPFELIEFNQESLNIRMIWSTITSSLIINHLTIA